MVGGGVQEPRVAAPVTGAESVSAATWAGFAVMGFAMFIAVLDVQIVATSLTTIQEALDLFPDQISWIQTAYLIAEVIAIPLTGFLIRALSMRGLFVIAITLFTFASVGCAGSDSFASLIAWRVLQGFAGGTLIPMAFNRSRRLSDRLRGRSVLMRPARPASGPTAARG